MQIQTKKSAGSSSRMQLEPPHPIVYCIDHRSFDDGNGNHKVLMNRADSGDAMLALCV
jgi:hypothetical protein